MLPTMARGALSSDERDELRDQGIIPMSLKNVLVQMKCETNLDLQLLERNLQCQQKKLYMRKPKMLTCLMEGVRVQFFPRGAIQVLGGKVTRAALYQIYQKVNHVLHLMNPPTTATVWTVKNKVYQFDLCASFNFSKFICNHKFSYEPELFPAALLSEWKPAHVTLFPSGKGLVTGITSTKCIIDIVCDIENFLTQHAHFSGL